MKIFYKLILFIVIISVQEIQPGVYKYTSIDYYESIEIKKNHQFVYKLNFNFAQYEVKGNYHILNDSLILNSYPQKDRIIVLESNKGKLKNITFNVKTKYGKYFYYDLHLVLNNNNHVILKNEWKKSKVKNLNIVEFYIIDKNGLKSPVYKIKGTASNNFEVFFEPARVFENESWGFKKDSIIPRNFNGELQNNYFLKK